MKSWRFFSISQSMKEKQRKGKKNKKNKLISDPRYLRVHTDPRFREAPKDETKVAIDSRFKHMFDGSTFFSNSAPIDKRGRPLENKLTLKSDFLRRYYKIINVDEDKVVDEEEGLMEKNDKGAESEETDESKSTTDEEESYTDEDTDTLDIQEEVSMIEEDTYRLAVVNRDWTCVKAVDLYVLFNSFVPPNGMIKSVAIYPTEFGLQHMKEENIHGPVLFDNENEKSDDEDNNEKKRAYQKIMMRFYYAVVECDSSTTATHIYEKCNGLEWLSTPLDLRFIPDIWEFKQEPRGDVVTEVPANYDFDPQALQHSKDDVTWDDDDAVRKRTLGRRFTDEQIAQLDCKDYLASDLSESDDNSETDDQLDEKARKQDMYLSLVYSENDSYEDVKHDEVGQEMEVTFHSGLECLNKKLTEKKDKISETVWEASMRKRREKKKAKKNKLKYSSDDDSDQQAIEEADEFFIEEPCVKKRKQAQSSKNDEDHNKFQHMDMVVVDKASKEELELLLADDKGTETRLKGYNLNFKKGKVDKMGKENVIIDEGKVPNSTYSDDPRFASLLTPDYAIDPTDPQFKRSAAYARKQLAHKQKKGQIKLSVPKVMQMAFEDSGNGMMQKDITKDYLFLNQKRKIKISSHFLLN